MLTLGLFAMPLHGQGAAALSLEQAVRTGLAQGPEAHISGDRVDVQRAEIAKAKLRPNPRLYVQSEDLRPWDHTFSFPDNTEDYGYLGQTIELGGKRGSRIAYAAAGTTRTEAQAKLQLLQIAGGIADAYWAAAATRAAAVEWRRQLADFDRLVQYQADRVRAGATAGVDLLRTQIERDRVALSLAQAERDAEAAAIELARRTGMPSARNATLTEVLAQERGVTATPSQAAVEQRPDVAAARDAVAEARADTRLQHAGAVPNLDLLGGYKRDVGLNTLYGGLQMDLPLFSRNQGGIAAARAGEQLAGDELAYTRMTAEAEIATAVSGYAREQALVRLTLPGMRERAEKNAAILSDAYRSGGTDLLRYLDAERMLIETRLLVLDTWTQYQRAVVQLQLAYGERP